MELTLKLLSGRSAGQEVKVPVNKFLIGRADDCHLRPHSDLVSRHHCVLLIEEGFCALRDFGSKNGTLVNEERVVGQRELKTGDRVKVGVLEFEVALSSSVGGKRRPKVKDVKDAAVRTAAGSPAGKHADDDIGNWLTTEDDDVPSPIGESSGKKLPQETMAVDMSTRETTFLKKPTEETTTITPQKAAAADPAKEPEAKGADAAKKLFGQKLAALPKVAPKNSHEAANEALKRLFNTRK